MAFSEENVLKNSIIQEIEGLIITTARIKQEINPTNDYFNNLPQITTEILTNKHLYKENPLDQISAIKTTLSKIRSSTISFKRLIEDMRLQSLNHLEKNELNHQLNEITTTLNIIKEKQITFNINALNVIQSIDTHIKTIKNVTQIPNEFSSNIKAICTHNNDILISLNYVYDVLSSTRESIERKIINISEKNNLNYIDRFKEDTDLIIKKYQNDITNLTEKFENQFKKFELNQNKVVKSSDLLSTGVDAGLKNLAELNERTQNIELEFSKIIGTETEKVTEDLNGSRTALMKVVDSITTEANKKLTEINTAHLDFINLVSNAGIYKLTENYDKKAKEEKKQYETYRTYTGRAIGAAIAFTIIILTIPLIEYWGATPAVDTNYYTILARLTISLMFFVLALYFSKQASKHYECYQENHRTFLQLAALEPFMARMTPEEQKEIRKSLVPSYFNQGSDGKFAAKGEEVDMSMMFTFMDKLSNFGQNKKDPTVVESPATETKP